MLGFRCAAFWYCRFNAFGFGSAVCLSLCVGERYLLVAFGLVLMAPSAGCFFYLFIFSMISLNKGILPLRVLLMERSMLLPRRACWSIFLLLGLFLYSRSSPFKLKLVWETWFAEFLAWLGFSGSANCCSWASIYALIASFFLISSC